MKALYQYIEARILARVPAVKTVKMWNNQLEHSNTSTYKEKGGTASYGVRDEKAFRYPAVFVEFIIEDVLNHPMNVRDYILTVRFRFARESYKFTRLETFDFVDDFDKAIQLMAPTTASGLTFTTFQEKFTEWDENHNNVEAPYRDYRTRYRYAIVPSTTTVDNPALVINSSLTTS